MRDVNGCSFSLLADPGDWSFAAGFAKEKDGGAFALASQQDWKFPPPLAPADAIGKLSGSSPLVRDEFGAIARIKSDGSTIESRDGDKWTQLQGSDGNALAPRVGRFVAMALADARLALLCTEGASSYLQLFDLRGRWPLNAPNNPPIPVTPDASGGVDVLAVAPDGAIFLVEKDGLGLYEGGPILEFFRADNSKFAPLADNPNPLRRTALIKRPGGKPIALAADSERVALLLDDGMQKLALLDRRTGQWTLAPVKAADLQQLPYATDVALLADGQIALVAPSDAPMSVRDAIVATAATSDGLQLSASRYPMLSQGAPRFTTGPGPDVYYLADGLQPRPLLPLPHPAYQPIGAMLSRTMTRNDPDQVWHRIVVEAHAPAGAALTFWARAGETGVSALPDPSSIAQVPEFFRNLNAAWRRLDARAESDIVRVATTAMSLSQSKVETLAAILEKNRGRLLDATAADDLSFTARIKLDLKTDKAQNDLREIIFSHGAGGVRLDAAAAASIARMAAATLGLDRSRADALSDVLQTTGGRLLDGDAAKDIADAASSALGLDKDENASLEALIQKIGAVIWRLDAQAAVDIARAAKLPLSLSYNLKVALLAWPFHRQPELALVPSACELPFHPGLAALAKEPGELYEVLLQRCCGANRRLIGSALDLVVVGESDGRHSPCLRAVRVYASRFCYQDEYLPALFHQTAISDEGDTTAPASPPDFRERFLAAFEGMLTPIEDRVAAAEYILDPYAAPVDQLPWLGSYLGLNVDPGWPEARHRRYLGEAGLQLRLRGTYRGVCLALDIATDGAVARGEIVVIETFRLRRTNATILGIPLSDRNILTQYGVASGNSIVGETLVLSPRRALDLLGLLSPEAAKSADAATVEEYLDQYADRIQIAALVAGTQAASLKDAVSSVLTRELPAHLRFEVILADRRFVLGLAPLLGAETFLDPPEAPASAKLDLSTIGRNAVIRDPAALRQ
jgi:phage tail-like protein